MHGNVGRRQLPVGGPEGKGGRGSCLLVALQPDASADSRKRIHAWSRVRRFKWGAHGLPKSGGLRNQPPAPW